MANKISKIRQMAKTSRVIGSVQRAIDILNLFDPHTPELGTTEIGRELGLPKSTVAGLIHTLEKNGYLDQNPETRKYRLGFKLAERAGVLLEQFDLRQVAAPVLESLRDTCNESVNLGVLDGDDVVYIERMHGMNMLGMRSEIGKREKAHSTALGKAILAYQQPNEIKSFVSRQVFSAVTPYTLTSAAEFTQNLRTVRECGFALDDQENQLGGRCVAAPIFNYQGKPAAAVSISVPLQRMPDEQIAYFGQHVLAAASEISRRLGARV